MVVLTTIHGRVEQARKVTKLIHFPFDLRGSYGDNASQTMIGNSMIQKEESEELESLVF